MKGKQLNIKLNLTEDQFSFLCLVLSDVAAYRDGDTEELEQKVREKDFEQNLKELTLRLVICLITCDQVSMLSVDS